MSVLRPEERLDQIVERYELPSDCPVDLSFHSGGAPADVVAAHVLEFVRDSDSSLSLV